MTVPPALRRMIPALLIFVVVPLVVACIPGAPGDPGASPPSPPPPLTPAQPGADPVSLLAWLFTPIFQAMFIVLIAVYVFLENLGVPGAHEGGGQLVAEHDLASSRCGSDPRKCCVGAGLSRRYRRAGRPSRPHRNRTGTTGRQAPPPHRTSYRPIR